VLANERARGHNRQIQEEFMLKFRLVFLGVASALVLGTGTALANVSWNGTGPTSSTEVTADAHGDAVSAIAKTAPKGEGDEHGDAVSKVASAKSEASEDKDGARAAAVAACKAKGVNEDKTEKKPVTKAEKTADRAEDKKEHKAFVACLKAAK
jgi:hypothetical protein